MTERYLSVRGKRLFLDVRGDPAAPALLYVHGGPGMSCYEFMHWQGDLLSRELLLIGLDQRGVLRSDPVADGDPLSEQVLVDDCEAIREQLGLGSWSLLGHSFGGRIALRYAHQHSGHLDALIFENPAWNAPATDRFRLPVLAGMLDEMGRADEARHCRELADRPDLFADGYPAEVMTVLGSLGARWYLHDPAAKSRMPDPGQVLPEEMGKRCEAHGRRIRSQPALLESLLPLLGELTVPTLLLLGKDDLVTSPDQVRAFEQAVPGGQVQVFAESGHFVQFEQAQQYAEAVTGFVLRMAGRHGRSG